MDFQESWAQLYVMFCEAARVVQPKVVHSVLVWDLPLKTLREVGKSRSRQKLQVAEGRCFQLYARKFEDNDPGKN